MSKFDVFKTQVLAEVEKLGQTTLTNFVTQAKSDTQQFLDAQTHALAVWTQELASGDIDKEDFNFLVHGQVALFQMHLLTQAGITAVQVQKFRDALIKIVVDAAVKIFIPI